MNVLNVDVLRRASKRHPQVARWLDRWHVVAESANWQNLIDVRRDYPSADGVMVGNGRTRAVVTVFNAGGNDFRLLTFIDYARQLVAVHDVLTHAEYDKDKWKW